MLSGWVKESLDKRLDDCGLELHPTILFFILNYRKCRKAPCFSYGDIRHNLLENSMFFNRFKSFDCII